MLINRFLKFLGLLILVILSYYAVKAIKVYRHENYTFDDIKYKIIR